MVRLNTLNDKVWPQISYRDAALWYGSDKPDLRMIEMEIGISTILETQGFSVFNSAELVVGISVPNGNDFTRKEIDKYVDWVKRPQIGASGMIYVRCNQDGTFKSSVDKFYDQKDLSDWADLVKANKGDIIFILSGNTNVVRSQTKTCCC